LADSYDYLFSDSYCAFTCLAIHHIGGTLNL